MQFKITNLSQITLQEIICENDFLGYFKSDTDI